MVLIRCGGFVTGINLKTKNKTMMSEKQLFNKAKFYLKIHGNKFTAFANCCGKCQYNIPNSGNCKRTRKYISYDENKKIYYLQDEGERDSNHLDTAGRCILWLDNE